MPKVAQQGPRGRKEIVLPPDAEAEPKAQPQRPLVLALARAHKWQRMLDEGEVGSLDEPANRHGVDRSYIGRAMRLNTLAPRIIEAALAGHEPSGFSLGKARTEFPMPWQEQLQHFRFSV